MNFTMTKIAVAAALALASTASMAAQEAFTNSGSANFTMIDPGGAVIGDFHDVTGWVDYAAGTFNVASVSKFYFKNWTASGGTLFGPGTYSIDVNGDGSDAEAGYTNPVSVTVGAGQMGGNIDFAWGTSTGIDVIMVWDVVNNGDGTQTFTSTDIDGSGWAGLGMIDGPFTDFSANFNFTAPVPEASTYGMMLAGLGLVGFAVRRRKLMA
jgi:hypothetical protein